MPVAAKSCNTPFKDSSGSLHRLRERTRVLMKMKRPFAQEITLLKSDSLGHGVSRCQTDATKSNWCRAKVCKSALAPLSVARSYKYDGWVRVSKKRWISTSGLLVMIILSHGACAVALVRTSKRRGRL